MKRRLLILMLAGHGCVTAVSLFIIHLFLFQMVKQKQKPLMPYWITLVCTAIFGSFAPMVYLILNDDLL